MIVRYVVWGKSDIGKLVDLLFGVIVEATSAIMKFSN